MFFFNNKIKVSGEIIRFDEENGQHYPVFAFTTIDGQRYVLRNVPKESDVKEISLEEVYTESGVIEKLSESFPIRDVIIKYNSNDPTDFIPKWI